MKREKGEGGIEIRQTEEGGKQGVRGRWTGRTEGMSIGYHRYPSTTGSPLHILHPPTQVLPQSVTRLLEGVEPQVSVHPFPLHLFYTLLTLPSTPGHLLLHPGGGGGGEREEERFVCLFMYMYIPGWICL